MKRTSRPARNVGATERREDSRLATRKRQLEADGYKAEFFWIPSDKLADLDKQIGRLQKRAARVGSKPIVYEKGETYWTDVEKEELHRSGTEFREKHGFVKREVTPVLVAGEEPRLSGWRLVALLDYDEESARGGPWLRVLPGETLPVEFRTVDPTRCDHCHTKRDRSTVFVVGHEDGRYAAVGRQCLMDFLGGHGDPIQAANAAENLFAIFDLARGLEDSFSLGGNGGGATLAFGIENFLAATAASISRRGWVSRSEAWEKGTEATADRAWETLVAAMKTRTLPLTDDDRGSAAKVLDWATGEFVDVEMNALGDYGYNARQAILSGVVTRRSAGIVASLVSGYQRALIQQAEALRSADSKHIGVVGARVVLDLTFTGCRVIEGHYGTTYLCMFVDPAGNVVKWFASSWIFDGFSAAEAPGKKVRLKATIKEHGEYKGTLETQLARAAIAPSEEFEKATAKKPRGSKLLVRVVVHQFDDSQRPVDAEVIAVDGGASLARIHRLGYYDWYVDIGGARQRGRFGSHDEAKEAALKKLKAVEQVAENSATEAGDASPAQVAEAMRVVERDLSDGDRFMPNRSEAMRRNKRNPEYMHDRKVGSGVMGHISGRAIDPDALQGMELRDVTKAMDRYEIFHQKQPLEVVHVEHEPPEQLVPMGFAVSSSYRTDKWKKDGSDIDYKHVHNDKGEKPYDYSGGHGVRFYENSEFVDKRTIRANGLVEAPKEYPEAWTRLGAFMGSDVRGDDGEFHEVDAKKSAKDCWLLCSPSGNMLAIYSPRPQADGSVGFLAIMCGGELRVIKDGIDG